jgi:hypothetical protein
MGQLPRLRFDQDDVQESKVRIADISVPILIRDQTNCRELVGCASQR